MILLPPAALFYILLLGNDRQWWPRFLGPWAPLVLLSIGVFLLALLVAAFVRSPLQEWIILFVLFIPLEFSSPFFRVPSLSPLDYFCGASLIALGFRYRWRPLWQQVRDRFGSSTLMAWYLFFVYSFVSAYLLEGNVRRTLRWTAFLFFYLLASMTVRSVTREEFFRTFSLIVTCLIGAIGMIAIGQFIYFHGDYQHVTTLFHQHNSTGAFLSLCLPTAWVGLSKSTRFRLIRYLLFSFGVLGLILCGSRGAWMGVVMGFVGVGLLKNKRFRPWLAWTPILVSLAVVGTIFVWNPVLRQQMPQHMRVGLNGRQYHWQAAATILKEHPWMGLGPGNYAAHIADYLTGRPLGLYQEDLQFNQRNILWSHLHNFYLQILVEYGLLGSTLFFFAFGSLVWRAFSSRTTRSLWETGFQMSIIGFLIHSMVDVLTVNGFDYLLAFLLAFSQAVDRSGTENRQIL